MIRDLSYLSSLGIAFRGKTMRVAHLAAWTVAMLIVADRYVLCDPRWQMSCPDGMGFRRGRVAKMCIYTREAPYAVLNMAALNREFDRFGLVPCLRIALAVDDCDISPLACTSKSCYSREALL